MRPFYATFAAVTLLGTAVAFGQSQSSPSQSDPSQSSSPPSDTSTPADTHPGNDDPQKTITGACRKMAADKKLTGDAKKQYLKDCEAGKKTREGH